MNGEEAVEALAECVVFAVAAPDVGVPLEVLVDFGDFEGRRCRHLGARPHKPRFAVLHPRMIGRE